MKMKNISIDIRNQEKCYFDEERGIVGKPVNWKKSKMQDVWSWIMKPLNEPKAEKVNLLK